MSAIVQYPVETCDSKKWCQEKNERTMVCTNERTEILCRQEAKG